MRYLQRALVAIFGLSLAATVAARDVAGIDRPEGTSGTTGASRGVATFEGIGDLPGDTSFRSFAKGLSGDGSVVVGTSDGIHLASEPFRWENGTMIGLGSITGEHYQGEGIDASADGSVVVGEAFGATSGYEAFRWEDGVMTGLGFPPGGNPVQSFAFGVSADGTIVVGGAGTAAGVEATVWENGTITTLGDLAGGAVYCAARGVSADGSVIVGQGTTADGTNGFRWEGGTMTSIGELPGGSVMADARGVSADGNVIVGYSRGADGYEAFRWQDGVMTGLGDFDGGTFLSFAEGVSGDGSLIVGYGTAAVGRRAAMWTADGMRDIKEVLEQDYGLDLTGWTLQVARAVSDDGRVIVGEGFSSDGGGGTRNEGWRVVLPPPVVEACPNGELLCEDFEEGIPGDWTIFANEFTNAASTWAALNHGTLGNIARSNFNDEVPVGEFAEDYIVTPQLALGAGAYVQFDAAQQLGSENGSEYEVLISTTTADDPAAYTTLASYTEADFPVPSAGAGTFTVDLSAYAGENVYVAFLHRQNNGDFFYLDNVFVSAVAPVVCPNGELLCEDFEEGIPGDWTIFANEFTNAASTWAALNHGTLGNIARSNFNDEVPVGEFAEDYIVTPQLALGAGAYVQFDAAQQLGSENGSEYEVLISTTTADDPAAYTTLASYTEADFPVPSAGAGTFTVDLSAYAGENVYVAFLHRQNNGDFFYLDNVIVPAPAATVPPTLAISFAPDTVETNEGSVLTVTLENAGPVDAILTAPFVNILPTGLTVGPMTTSCLDAQVAARGGGIVLPAGVGIPANSSCEVEATVQAAASGSYVDTIEPGDLQTDQGSNADGASATLTVNEPVVPEPIAVVTPVSLDFTIEEGASLTNALTIGNSGEGDLDWSIAESTSGQQGPDFSNVRAAQFDASATLEQGHGAPGIRGAGEAVVLGEAMISQMLDNTPDVFGVSCGATDGSNTGDNSWWRRFYFNEHPEVGATANITAVTVSSGGNPIPSGLPFTINLYTIDHAVAVDTIPTASLTLIGSASSVVSEDLVSVTVPVTGSIGDTANLDLVVEYHTDGVDTGRFFPGANDTSETHPSFMSSVTCDITEPTQTAAIGFPDFHLTMVVTLGDGGAPTACENPADIAWLDAVPGSGTVAPGASTDVAVSADAGALTAGEYSANLCVTTNDPTQPLITVPVNLTVTPAAPEPPVAVVTPVPLAFTVEAGESLSGPLSIGNTGGSDLAWSIAESAAGQNPPSYKTARTAKTRMSAALATVGQDRISGGSGGFGEPVILGDSMISQMEDNTPGDFGVSCGTEGVSTADNSWWRRFYFDEHPQVGASANIASVTVSSGSIAIPGGLPITINLYTIPHATPVDTIPTASLTLIGSADATITDSLASITVPVTGTVGDTAGLDLVVEYFTAGNASGGQFFPGANDTPETHPTFLSSATCDLLEPGTTASIGFPDFHLTMVVNLGTGDPPGACENPGDVAWLGETPVSGVVVPGASTDVTVTADAATLAAGAYSAKLCVTTNDPLQPLIAVPVSLTVTPAAIPDRVFCSGFESGETGTCDSAPPVDENVADSGPLDAPLLASFDGTWVNWATGEYGDGSCPAALCNWNPYDNDDGLTFYWPESASDEGGVSLDGLAYAVLGSGAIIGSSSQFIAMTGGADYGAWRAGADGYLGFRFACAAPGGLCYGYARLITTAGNGFPATLVRYWYNSAGDSITIR